MKVLVAANKLSLGRTSEGICTSKFVRAISRAGHEVWCVTADGDLGGGDDPFTLPWLPGVSVTHVARYEHGPLWRRISAARRRAASSSSPAAYLDRKSDPVAAYTTGHSLVVWELVVRWRVALRVAMEEASPDVVVSRASGVEFEPHMALLLAQAGAPVVANYHDPYPHSLFPEPYRRRSRIISRRQESLHRRMLRSADALTFPGERLRDWIVGKDDALSRKAFVVPHIGGALEHVLSPTDATDDGRLPGEFVLVHAGTLLAGRDPRPLLRAFDDLLRVTGGRGEARLHFVGKVSPQHQDLPEWRRLSERGHLVADGRRVGYRDAMRASGSAAAGVILEAGGAESPFFPAKLADALWLDKPILALTPERSQVTDVLGHDYALRCDPGDRDAISKALTMLWERWEEGRLDELRPPAGARASVSEEKAVERAERAIHHAISARRPRLVGAS